MTDTGEPDGYPIDLVMDLAIADGRVVHLRPISPADEAAYRAFAATLSPEAIYYRFFSPRHSLSEREIDHFLHVDYHDRLAIVAEVTGQIVGVGRYDRTSGTRDVEVAFVVLDDFQGVGIASSMLQMLRDAANHEGADRMVASVLPDNHKMLHVFTRTGWVTERYFEDGVVNVALSVADPPATDPTN